jgi:hypothetical protein
VRNRVEQALPLVCTMGAIATLTQAGDTGFEDKILTALLRSLEFRLERARLAGGFLTTTRFFGVLAIGIFTPLERAGAACGFALLSPFLDAPRERHD